MKKLRLMSLIVLVPIILGIVMLIIGSNTGNSAVAHAGSMVLSFGVPITMVILVAVGIVLMMTGKLNLSDVRAKSSDSQCDGDDEYEEEGEEEYDTAEYENHADETRDEDCDVEARDEEERDDKIDAPKSGAQREYEEIAEINSSRGYASKIREAQYMTRHAAENYRNTPQKGKVLGFLLFGFLITDFIMIIVFGMLGIFVGAIVCFCLFGGTILIAIAVTVIMQKISMRKRLTDEEIDNAIDGKVRLCTMSSSTSTGGERYTRITSVVYKVIVAANDREYTAYSKKFYEAGDTVKLVTRGNKRIATIVDPEELEDSDDEE